MVHSQICPLDVQRTGRCLGLPSGRHEEATSTLGIRELQFSPLAAFRSFAIGELFALMRFVPEARLAIVVQYWEIAEMQFDFGVWVN